MSLWIEIAALLAAFAAAGGFLGLACGALRVGGGAFGVMLLHQFLLSMGFDGPEALRVALGGALATLALMSAQAALAHRRQGTLDARALRAWTPWAAAGAALGGLAAAHASTGWLSAGVGAAVLAAGLRLAFEDARRWPAPGLAGRAALGLAIGAVSGGAGLGAGSLMAPVLSRLGVDARTAAGQAAALGALICAVAGAMLATADVPGAPVLSLGAVNLPGAAAAAMAAGAAAPLGAWLAREAPPWALRAVAAFLLCVSGLALLRAGLGG